MTSETLFNLFIIISPFLAAYLTYYFGIKGKRKDIDLEKEKELNTILSNLMVVWHYLSKLEHGILILKQDDKQSIIPKSFIPKLMLQTGMLNDGCFAQLDLSTELLKKYDPILYFKLEGIGGKIETIKSKYLMPFLTKSKLPSEMIILNSSFILKQTLNDIEELMDDLAKEINPSVLADVRSYISKHRETTINDLIEEFNKSYYALVLEIIPEEGEKPTYEAFLDVASSNEFKQQMEFQVDLVLNGNLNEFLKIIESNPDISIEEAQKRINSKKKKWK